MASFNPKSMNTYVNMLRRKNNYTFNINNDILIELKVTKKDKEFLFFDSGIEDANRIVVFTKEENLEHFINCKTVICDGTFKSSPSNFEQLFTLQC